jgi:hypothetical protein
MLLCKELSLAKILENPIGNKRGKFTTRRRERRDHPPSERLSGRGPNDARFCHHWRNCRNIARSALQSSRSRSSVSSSSGCNHRQWKRPYTEFNRTHCTWDRSVASDRVYCWLGSPSLRPRAPAGSATPSTSPLRAQALF